MSYSNSKKIIRRKFVASAILFLIGISIGCLMISGIIHIFCCRCITTVEATEMKPIEEPEIISLGEYKVTAYCACEKCCGKTDGITKSGVRAKEGVTIAADPNVIPLGTEVIIDGHEYIVQDTGGAIKGNRIDIYFDHHQEALEFGVQYKEIFTMKEGENYDKV